ncbi:hypothetical protein RRG08_013605 [Elysia crispata]|uniref:Uncharacterized protein n=1 Tax=Elysia crispata TaxID=231223 RepID=A0AAE1ANI1_9GAST|nr:hypothetical protein RRG08_013605 [Elysia crispata]
MNQTPYFPAYTNPRTLEGVLPAGGHPSFPSRRRTIDRYRDIKWKARVGNETGVASKVGFGEVLDKSVFPWWNSDRTRPPDLTCPRRQARGE